MNAEQESRIKEYVKDRGMDWADEMNLRQLIQTCILAASEKAEAGVGGRAEEVCPKCAGKGHIMISLGAEPCLECGGLGAIVRYYAHPDVVEYVGDLGGPELEPTLPVPAPSPQRVTEAEIREILSGVLDKYDFSREGANASPYEPLDDMARAVRDRCEKEGGG